MNTCECYKNEIESSYSNAGMYVYSVKTPV